MQNPFFNFLAANPLVWGVAVMGSILASLVAKKIGEYFQKSISEKRFKAERELIDSTSDVIANILSFLPDLPEESRKRYADYLARSQRSDGSFPEAAIILMPHDAKDSVKEEIQGWISSLKERIDQIEERFPAETNIAKIASVNDAILATNIEKLAESVKRLEDKMLTKWDVAKIVFQVLAVLIGIMGLAITILKFIGTNSG